MRQRTCGRSHGPKFIWECAMKDIASPGAGATVASREWRGVAEWTKQLAAAASHRISGEPPPGGTAGAANAARKRLARLVARMRLEQQHGDRSSDQGPRLAAWLAIHRADHPSVLQRLSELATNEAVAIENCNAKMMKARWKQWLSEGPVSGLRNQHRFTRTPTGWVPCKVAARPPSMLSAIDDISDLTTEELRRIVKGDPDDVAPLSPQDAVEQEAIEWGKLWATQEQMPPLRWPAELGPMPPRPIVDQLRAALATFPVGTGLASDALHPRALSRLVDARLEN